MIRQTEDGINWYEDEFPPKRGMIDRYYGYDTWNECMLFHEFAVNMYDMFFSYKGKEYVFNIDGDGVLWINPDNDKSKKEWDTAVEFIKDFKLDGRPLCEMVNELEDIDWM